VVINPATPVHMLDEVLDIVHHVLVMSVNPGILARKNLFPGRYVRSKRLLRFASVAGYRSASRSMEALISHGRRRGSRRTRSSSLAGNAVFAHGPSRQRP